MYPWIPELQKDFRNFTVTFLFLKDKFGLHSQNKEQPSILRFQLVAHLERLLHCHTKRVPVAAIKYFIFKWENQNLLHQPVIHQSQRCISKQGYILRQANIVFMVVFQKGYHRSFQKRPCPHFSQRLLNTSMAPQKWRMLKSVFALFIQTYEYVPQTRLPLSRSCDPKVKPWFTNVNNKEAVPTACRFIVFLCQSFSGT